jgi:hypothetical protein
MELGGVGSSAALAEAVEAAEPDAESNRFGEMFNPNGYDQTYFSQFETSPHELSFLAVHDFRNLHMKNIYYYQMEILRDYPEKVEINTDNVARLRELLAGYSISRLSLT